jgi:hypothetical protein
LEGVVGPFEDESAHLDKRHWHVVVAIEPRARQLFPKTPLAVQLASDKDWLHKATKEIAKYWRQKRQRYQCSAPAQPIL